MTGGKKKNRKILKNGQATMPEGQITDGQTELQKQCQGIEEAVAELDNIIRKDCKIDSANVNHCRAIPTEKQCKVA